MWLKNRLFQKMGGGRMEWIGLGLWSRLQISALQARKDKTVVALLREILREKRSLLSAWEQYLVYSVTRAQRDREGAIAEVGVYRGGSAKMICAAKGDKPLFLFDTFTGLPESHAADRGVHRKNQYACSLEEVQEYLASYPNIQFYPGIFPESAANVPEQRYCFAHFDVDLYEGTKACLEYFYPRMIPGGIMISHDFGLLAGVEQAFHEFFTDKPEEIIDQPTTQCLIVKQ